MKILVIILIVAVFLLGYIVGVMASKNGVI